MPTEKETIMIQKATIYDIQKIFKGRRAEGKTYTLEEIEEVTDAYVTGLEQK